MTLAIPAEQNGHSDECPAIIVLDHYALSRSCLARVLRSEFPGFAVLEVEDAQQIGDMAGKYVSVVALNTGHSFPTDECVLQSLACLQRLVPNGPFMLLTQIDEAAISDAVIVEVTRYGVRGYVADSASIDIALAALRLLMAGGVYFPRSMLVDGPDPTLGSVQAVAATQPAWAASHVTVDVSLISDRTNIAFTERERQVLATLLRGLSNKVIAHELNLSQNTVKSHISHIMRKLHATNRTEAVILSQYACSVPNGGAGAPRDLNASRPAKAASPPAGG
ncbi:MAG: response regulator transcription factor [Pseudaminobacter sp.]